MLSVFVSAACFTGSTTVGTAIRATTGGEAEGGGWFATSSSIAVGRDFAACTAGPKIRSLWGCKSGRCRFVADDKSGPDAGGSGCGGEIGGGMFGGGVVGPCAGGPDGGMFSGGSG